MTVGNLGDEATLLARGRRLRNGGSGSLDLAIIDLAYLRSRSGRRRPLPGSVTRSLYLTIIDLAHLGTRSWGRGLLAGPVARSLDLTVADLRSLSPGNWVAPRADLDLNGDSLALRGPVAVIEIIELSRATLVEGRGGTEGQDVVLAYRETRGEDGTGLRGTIELELEVGGNVSSSALGVPQNTILQGQSKGTLRACALLQTTQSAFVFCLQQIWIHGLPQRIAWHLVCSH